VTAQPATGPQSFRGARLGLPADGPGSLASVGRRIGAFLLDAIASSFVAGLFTEARHGNTKHLPGSWSLIPLAVDYLVGLMLAGQTLGMYPFGLRVVRIDRDVRIGLGRAVLRTLLLFLLVPAVIWDRDGRGMHDRAADTAVIRA
jgi:uncharacterized RDD family membrane protein YckC